MVNKRNNKIMPILSEPVNQHIGEVEENPVISYCSLGNPYSYFLDDEWYFFETGNKLSFNTLVGDFKEKIKIIIYKSLKVDELSCSLETYKSCVIMGAVCIQKVIMELGGNDFSFIDSDVGFRNFINVAKSKKIKYKTWRNQLVTLSKLYQEGMINRKINDAKKLALNLSSLSEDTKQTMAIPENIASQYLGFGLEVVEKYYPYRYKISDAYNCYLGEIERQLEISASKSRKKDIGGASRKAKNITSHDIPFKDFSFDLKGYWLYWLRGACYSVIAGFTGCRDGEIKSFGLNSYDIKEYAGLTISILNGIHTKPNIAGVERATSWVTIPQVKNAIELLWFSFDFARNIWKKNAEGIKHIDERKQALNESNKLFISLPYVAKEKASAGRQTIQKSLNSFARSVEYVATIDDVQEFNLLNPTRRGELKLGGVLIPHPHAFRRTFAVFLVRNKLGTLVDLKYQFKHINIAMTIWYSNQANVAAYFDMMLDDELKDLIAEENHNMMTDTLYHIYNEAESLSGKEGARIMGVRNNTQASIYLSREEISRQIRLGQMSIIENPLGYCTNPSCNRICDMQTCKYKIVTKDKAVSLIPKKSKLINKFEAMKSFGVKMPNVMSKLLYDIKSIEQCLSDHDIEFELFDETI